ncbi:AAA family ATPase [Baaleninema sp.]|uniref:AAA family ATPase n=1 Tax=Baaleninema sp. TaxID=3101197 RepID=UPI003CFF2BE0
MASIEQIVQRAVNPFDSTTFRPGNFWHEDGQTHGTIESIHQDIVADVESILNRVASDGRSRTILLSGDSGSGKSFLLSRLKKRLNPQAFFAYIGPWPESDYIWRHTLRHTIDSLTYVPEGQRESQLLLWLKSLSAFREGGFLKRLIGERHLFVHNFKSTYPTGIYNANEFFSILYYLTEPKRYSLACDWLKGDDLDEESLRALHVSSSIDTEHKAQSILANFGRIATATQPIVLCFDNLDNVDRSDRGYIDLQALFNVNSIVHNQKLRNFLVIVSIVTNTWNENARHVQGADLARIDTELHLRPIDIDRAQQLWEIRLAPLHRQADNPPPSPVYPLSREALERKFPGDRALPRSVLMLGRSLFQQAKVGVANGKSPHLEISEITEVEPEIDRPTDKLAAFKLAWETELAKVREKVHHIRQFSAPELMQMLRQVLEVLGVTGVQPKLLESPTYGRYSLSFYWSFKLGRVGVIWIEEPNLGSFCRVMKAAQEALAKNTCQFLYLIRAENLGVPRNQGYRRYKELFVDSIHRHIIPDLESLHILETYHRFVNSAKSEEFVLSDRLVDFEELKELTIRSEVLQDCRLLQKLDVFSHDLGSLLNTEEHNTFDRAKEYIFALVKTQQLIGQTVLVESAKAQFPELKKRDINKVISTLCKENCIAILNPDSNPEEHLISYIISS